MMALVMTVCRICENITMTCLAATVWFTDFLRKTITWLVEVSSQHKDGLLSDLAEVKNMFVLGPVLITYCCCVLLTTYDALGFGLSVTLVLNKVMMVLHTSILIAAILGHSQIRITCVWLAQDLAENVRNDGLVLQLTLLLFKHSYSYENMS